tara:strand:+ start:247 stop:369 length:123 start_codon:yes stop_codon:yes gene_type:complete
VPAIVTSPEASQVKGATVTGASEPLSVTVVPAPIVIVVKL